MRQIPKQHLRVIGDSSRDLSDAMSPGSYIPNTFRWSQRMYCIAFDLDTEMLEKHYPGNTHSNAYQDIERIFRSYGFLRQQGSVYFGDAKQVDPVTCVLAVQELVKKHPWFRTVVRDIRMMRVEENNNLMPAVGDFELPLPMPGTAAE